MEFPRPAVSILVVEDEAITLEFLVATLARKYPAATIHKALNGRIGLEQFETYMPNIVITDINMPGISGMQMAGKIRELKPGTKIIVLTGDNRKLTSEASGNGSRHRSGNPL
jgi:two-component system response regulator YesN